MTKAGNTSLQPWRLFILGVDDSNIDFDNMPYHVDDVRIVRYSSAVEEYRPEAEEHTHDTCLRAVRDFCDIALVFAGRRYGGTYAGSRFVQGTHWPFRLSITHAEYRLARDEGIPTKVFRPAQVKEEYKSWRTQSETKATLRTHRVNDTDMFCSAVWDIAGQNRQMCFLLELADGLPPDHKYQTFFVDCPFEIGEDISPQQWISFLRRELPAFGKELLGRVTAECSSSITSVALSWGISLEWLREKDALLTPRVRRDGKKVVSLLDAVCEGDAKVFILIGDAHSGKTTAILDTADRLTTSRGRPNGSIVLALRLLDRPPFGWRNVINHVAREELHRGPFPWPEASAEETFLFVDGLDDGQNLDAQAVKRFLVGIRTFPGRIVLSARPEWYSNFRTVIHRTVGKLVKLNLEPYDDIELKRLSAAVAGGGEALGLDGVALETPLQAVVEGRLRSRRGSVRADHPLESFICEHAAVLWEKLRGQRKQTGTEVVLDMWTTGVMHAYREVYQDPFVLAAQPVVPELARCYSLSVEECRRVLQEVFYLNDELEAIRGTKYRFYDDALASRAVIKAALSGDSVELRNALLIPPWYGFQKALRRRIEWAASHDETTVADVFESLWKYARDAGRVSSAQGEAALSSAVFLLGQIADIHPKLHDDGVRALQDLLKGSEPNSFCQIGILFALMILGEWSAEERLTKTLCEVAAVADRNARFHIAYFNVVAPSWPVMTGRKTIDKCDCSIALDAIVRYLARGKVKDAIRGRVYVRLFLDILQNYHSTSNMTRSAQLRRLAGAISSLQGKTSALTPQLQQKIHTILTGAEGMIAVEGSGKR